MTRISVNVTLSFPSDRAEGLTSSTRRCLLIACLVLAVGGVGASACSKEYRCSGSQISCARVSGDRCAQVPGCRPGPGCFYKDDRGTTGICDGYPQDKCEAPVCRWDGLKCADACSAASDQLSCLRILSPELDEFGRNKWFCDWVNCLGAPEKKYCDMYSNESCPAFQGCEVVPVQNF